MFIKLCPSVQFGKKNEISLWLMLTCAHFKWFIIINEKCIQKKLVQTRYSIFLSEINNNKVIWLQKISSYHGNTKQRGST